MTSKENLKRIQKHIKMYVREEEKAEIEAAAKELSLSTTAFVKYCVMKELNS